MIGFVWIVVIASSVGRFDPGYGDRFDALARDMDVEICVVSTGDAIWSLVRGRHVGLNTASAYEHVRSCSEIVWKVHRWATVSGTRLWLESRYLHPYVCEKGSLASEKFGVIQILVAQDLSRDCNAFSIDEIRGGCSNVWLERCTDGD